MRYSGYFSSPLMTQCVYSCVSFVFADKFLFRLCISHFVCAFFSICSPKTQKLRLSPNKPSLLPVCLTHPVAPMVWAFLAVKVWKAFTFLVLVTFLLLCSIPRVWKNTMGIELLLFFLYAYVKYIHFKNGIFHFIFFLRRTHSSLCMKSCCWARPTSLVPMRCCQCWTSASPDTGPSSPPGKYSHCVSKLFHMHLL